MRSYYLELLTVESIAEACLLAYTNTKVVGAGGGPGIRRTYQAHVAHRVKVEC